MTIMRMKTLLYTWILLLAALGLTSTASAQDVAGDLLQRINSLRTSLGLSPYNINGSLTAAASQHAQWMVATPDFRVSHYWDDGTGPRNRALAAGYPSNWVSENIYVGTNATVDSAWQFWINSPVHYAGLTSVNYADIGIASASNNGGQSFVLVFGNPGVSLPASTNRNGGNNASASDVEQANPLPPPPSFIVGVDAVGNIMHEIQEGDTIGDIALLYGYTWDDIPYMLEINGMTEDDIRSLEVGAIFLVPPYDGTYTPTPPQMTDTPTPQATFTPTPGTEAGAESTEDAGLLPPATYVVPSPTQRAGISIGAVITATPQTQTIASVSTPVQQSAVIADTSSPPDSRNIIFIAIAVQVGVLLTATVEFIRRARK